jgi:hypothetical protein
MNSLMRILQVVAVFCAYLVISIPAVFALQINVYMPGGAQKVFTFDPSTKISRNISVVHDPTDARWENVQVKVEIVGIDPSYAINNIYLFKCKNMSPNMCAAYEPIEAKNYLSGEKGTFYWNDVSGNSASGPVAGFLSLVEMSRSNKTMWVGFWDEVKRDSVTSFSKNSFNLDSMDIYAKPGVDSEWISRYIQDYFMVPMVWVERAVLGVLNGKLPEKIYKLGAGSGEMGVPTFQAQAEDTSTVSAVTKDYTFIFGKGSTSNPITFVSGSPTTCGDGACENLLGETSQTCCADCGCQANYECTVSGQYPAGVCHQCGNGIQEPSENSTTCCADMGCPIGQSCDASVNPPYGVCVLPSCGNGRCDTPAETVGNCCTDCGGGAACAGQFGSGYYCSTNLMQCVKPACGQRGCETGENSTTCCADCGGCPSGQYCNTNETASGVCMPNTCGNGVCEPGENPSNCCLDCAGCPSDYAGNQQTCSANKCHFCGNDVAEPPAETEGNCCQDAGCADDGQYCSQAGSCIGKNVMVLSAFVVPENIDCTIGGKISIRISIQNKPRYFSSFYSASYTYAGYSALMTCTENGDNYECEIPTSGSDSFPGCFEPGQKTVNLTVNVVYYKDKEAQTDGDSTTAAVTGSANLNIQKSRSRVCNKNGQCEAGIGEVPESCCWDCGCGGGLVCASTGCIDGSGIALQVDEASFPAKAQIDCPSGAGRIDYFARVINTPYSAADPFRVVSWTLFYGSNNYTKDTLAGFSCEPETGSQGMATGRVSCSIPVALFPPCPYDPPAGMSMELGMVGGGLSDTYGSLTGKKLSDDFNVDYTKGLPNCGNGAMDAGETSDNCCRDLGCPAGKLCSLYSGCIDEGQMDINVTVVPASLNCSSSGTITFLAEVNPKPLSMIRFESTTINRTMIDQYCGADDQSGYVLRCEIPLADFPYCWETGSKEVTFETSLVYKDGNDTITKRFSKPASFFASGRRDRQCNMNGACEVEIGELPDLCCADCGCTGGLVCSLTGSYSCRNAADIVLRTDRVNAVDCSGQEGYTVTINSEIVNQPHGINNIGWYIRMGNQTYGQDILSCQIREGESKYRCEVSVYNFPLCHGGGLKNMTLGANISYIGDGYLRYLNVESSMNVDTRNYLSSCTNNITGGDPSCQPELGENQTTCCQDCGCLGLGADYVCTTSGCQTKGAVKFTVSPTNVTSECTLIPAAAGEKTITAYECHFNKPIEVEAIVQNLPVHGEPTELTYYLDGNKSGKIQDNIAVIGKTARGWKIAILPRPIESSTKNIPTSHKLGIGFTLVVSDQGKQIVIPLEGQNEVTLTYSVKISDYLIDLEKKLAEDAKAGGSMKIFAIILSFIVGFCTPCFALGIGLALYTSLGGTIAGIVALATAAGMAGVTGLLGSSADAVGAALAAFAAGLALGYAAGLLSDWGICETITIPCVVIVVAGVIALMAFGDKLKGSSDDAKPDIQKDIALAKAEVHDDLSFYYNQQGAAGGSGG